MSAVSLPLPLRFGNTKNGDKPSLICFSHLRWNFVLQRPQHLLTRATSDFNVLYFEEPVFEAEGRSHLDVKETDDGVAVVTPVLPAGLSPSDVIVTQRRLLNLLVNSLTKTPSVAWYYTPMALQFSAHLQFECVVYDCMDELSNFLGAPSDIRVLETELFHRADVVFTGGRALYESKLESHSNIHAFPSSIDRNHFTKARVPHLIEDPADQREIPHPRIGFFGVIDERSDLKMIEEVALLRPEYQFVILGPVVKIDPASLPRSPNIHWLGQKHYNQLPAYMAHWNAGFMPFAINDATRFISPTKTPEFLAAGLPVVSTPIVDVVRSWGKSGLVSIAGTAEEMCDEIDRALIVDRSLWLKRVDQALAALSWDKTYASMLHEIRNTFPGDAVATKVGSVPNSTVADSHV